LNGAAVHGFGASVRGVLAFEALKEPRSSAWTRTVVLASLAALWCSPPAGAETIDELYAKKEKTLVVWAADPTAGYDDAIRAFEQAIPRHRMVIGCSFGPR
jgi:hypothetical protein